MEQSAHRTKWQAIAEHDGDPFEKIDRENAFLEEIVIDSPRDVRQWAGEVLEQAQRIGYHSGIAFSKGILGYAHYMLSDHETALPLLLEAMHLIQHASNPSVEGRIAGAIADVYISLGDFNKAVTYGYQALDLMREAGDRIQEGWTLHGFGIGFLEMGVTDKALANFQESLEIFKEQAYPQGIARALTGIGSVYQHQGRYEEARTCHVESLEIFQKLGQPIGEARACHDLGCAYLNLGDTAKAHQYLQESLQIRRKVGNRQSQSTSLLNLGRAFLAEGKIQEAIDHLNQALEIAIDVKARTRIYQVHEVLSEACEKAGRWTEALAHHRAFFEMKEEVFGDEMNLRINSIQASFKIEQAQKEAEIAQLRNVELREKNDQLERLLAELKNTQAQLVQSEKMASLGLLTAGIAHEIKNPLNFVNNFAALSIELMEELDELVEMNREEPLGQVRDVVDELLTDLRFNTSKIREHGQRADLIVRSMLEHAGGRSSIKQEFSVNELLREYVKLAYHGMRAIDNTFTINIEEDYAPDIPPFYAAPHDLGRVFLNILNNAFYAIREKQETSSDPDYRPRVAVSTRMDRDGVAIRITDNGTGIPADIQKNIFNPFFTTKPSGAGTGLGLSLSYDIITQGHGGRLEVESQEGQGAAFTIYIPASKT